MTPPTGTSFGFVELHAGTARVRIVPELGGKIVSLEAEGREWLWMRDDAVRPDEKTSGVDRVHWGGYDDCFPTKSAGRIPDNVPHFGGLVMAEGGELQSERPSVAVETSPDGQQAVCTWEGRLLPYRFTRTVQVTSAGTVIMRYAVANVGKARLPFVWVGHSVLPLTAATHLDLPSGARVRIAAAHGSALRGLAPEFRWPVASAEKRSFDFSHPDLIARRYACQLFMELPEGTKLVAVAEGGARLEMGFTAAAVRNLGLWLNKREWAPDHRVKPALTLALEPRIGSSDSLAEALGASNGAEWLAPGEARAWELSWRAVSKESPAGGRTGKRG